MKKQLLKFRHALSMLVMLLVCTSAWGEEVTGTINFGSGTGNLAVSSTSVNGDDSQGNNWTVTTVMTETSFTQNADYSQIGAAKKPATSITFTTTLPASQTITSFSAKFGGFSGTAGTVTLKVGDTTVGTGSLNGTTNVTVSNTNSTTSGTVLTVTVTDIAKGVKAYYISYTYTTGSSSSETPTVTAPTLSPAAGTYIGTQTVKVGNYDSNYLYAYTTDGSDPAIDEELKVTGTEYDHENGIEISSSCTLKIIAADEDGNTSSVTTAAYAIEASIANSAETAYTVAEAKALIDANSSQLSTTKVYVKGTVSKIDGFNSTYGSITYWLDSDAFEIYGGLNNNGEKFTSIDDIKVGATVIVYGIIKKYNSTYETNQNSWLVSYTAPAVEKTTATMTLGTYLKSLPTGFDDEYTVTYNGDATVQVTSSDEAVATATLAEGKVTVSALKAGTTTITVSAAETDSYTSVSKNYTLNVADPAQLPFSFDGGKADIENTTGMNQTGLGSTDYSESPKLKFDGAGDNVIIVYGEAAKKVTYTAKGNGSGSDAWAGQFDVMESADGKTYTTVKSHTDLTSTATEYTAELKAASRYVKFVYTTKNTGNVALGAIKIVSTTAKADPTITATYKTTMAVGDEADVVTISYDGDGTLSAESSETGVATVALNEKTLTVTPVAVGTTTITVSAAETDNYNAATMSYTLTVTEAQAAATYYAVVSKYGNKYYAMGSTLDGKTLNAVEVTVYDGKVINAADQDAISWTLNADGTVKNKAGNYVSFSKADVSLGESSTSTFTEETDDNGSYWMSGTRAFLYRESAEGFKTYAESNAGNEGYGTVGYLMPFATMSTATITLNAACNDGEKVYGTYSNESAFVVPAGLTVSAVAVLDGKLVVSDYATGEVVPANTGVMVSAEKWESGTKNFNAPLTTDAGVEKTNNLQPSSKEMTGDNKYYRLTMHNGTQIGFWWGAENGAAFTLSANKAYLAVPKSDGGTDQGEGGLVKSYWFTNDNETTINNVQLGNALSAKDGKYMENGRIVIVKNGVKYNATGLQIR